MTEAEAKNITHERDNATCSSNDLSRSVYYLSAVLFMASVPFLGNMILAKRLSQDHYALFGLLFAFAGMANAIAQLGQPNAFTATYFADTRLEYSARSIKQSAQKVIWWGVAAACILWVIYWQLKLRAQLPLDVVCLVAALITAKAFWDFFANVACCLDLYRPYAWTAVYSSISILICLLLWPSNRTYFLAAAVAYACGSIQLHLRTQQEMDVDPREEHPSTATTMLKIGWVTVPGMLVTSGLTFGERGLISHFLTNRDLAVYVVATTIAVSGPRVLVAALLKAGLVRLLGALQNRDDQAAVRHTRSMNHSLLSALLLFAVSVHFGSGIFIRFFGQQYAPAIPLLIPLFSIATLEGFSTIQSQPVMQKGKLGTLVSIGVAMTIISLFANYLLIPRLGLTALIVSFAGSTLSGLLAYYINARRFGSKLPFPSIPLLLILGLNLLTFSLR